MLDIVKFGRYMQQLRKIKGLTSYQLAKILHISEYYLQEIESGRSKPSIEVFLSIINYFGITADDYSNFNISIGSNKYINTNIDFEFTDAEYKFLYETIRSHITHNKNKGLETNV